MDSLFQIRQTKQMGRGAFALKDLQVQTRLMSLDDSEYITYNMLVDHQFFCKLFEFAHLNLNKKVEFAFYMAFVSKYQQHQKYSSKGLIPYIENLPEYFHNLICWKEDELNQLKNEKLIKDINTRKNTLKQQFQKVKKSLVQNLGDIPRFYPCSYQDKNWDINDQQNSSEETQQCEAQKNSSQETQQCEASNQTHSGSVDITEYESLCANIQFEEMLRFYAAIQSRNVHYQTDNDKKSELGALVSVLELFNHSPQGQAEKDGMVLKVTKPIKKGEQIFVSYGNIHIDHLLEQYGFVLDQHFQKIKNESIPKEQPSNIPLESGMHQPTGSNFSADIEARITEERLILAQKYNYLYEKN